MFSVLGLGLMARGSGLMVQGFGVHESVKTLNPKPDLAFGVQHYAVAFSALGTSSFMFREECRVRAMAATVWV